jgi:ketosteroid isomerase-like protein
METHTPAVTVATTFFEAFAQLNANAMCECYQKTAVFNDPVFGLLHYHELTAMWQMLCSNATNFSLQYETPVTVDNEYVTVNWVARYTFSATGKAVVNKVKSFIRIQNGYITEQSDAFKLSKWAAQALGIKGLLFGWSGFVQKRIRKNARKALEHYMEQGH